MLHRVLKRTIAQRVLWKCCEEFCREVLESVLYRDVGEE